MWTVSIPCNHFKPLNSVRVPNNVVQQLWPVLLDPGLWFRRQANEEEWSTYHGSSYGRALSAPLAGALPLAVEEDIVKAVGKKECKP